NGDGAVFLFVDENENGFVAGTVVCVLRCSKTGDVLGDDLAGVPKILVAIVVGTVESQYVNDGVLVAASITGAAALFVVPNILVVTGRVQNGLVKVGTPNISVVAV
ncbi:unnamed protein product, partial [Rotaria sp. Silwood2]